MDEWLARAAAAPIATVLSAMVVPFVLISACGSLAISTSNRLGRTLDRARKLFERFGELTRSASEDADALEEREAVYRQLALATARARRLQRALAGTYLAIGLFVGTSLSVVAVAFGGASLAFVPVVLGVAGSLLLLHSSVLLTLESRDALRMIDGEMDYVTRVGDRHAPEAWRRSAARPHFRWTVRGPKRVRSSS